MSELNFDAVNGEYEESTEVVQAGQIFDLDIVRPKFADYAREATRISDEAQFLEVQDQDSLNVAVALGGTAKKISKAIDAKRRAIILEPAEFVKGVNAMCRVITDRLDEAERRTKGKIGQHQAKVELERREAERKAREAADALQRKLDAEVAEANRKAQAEARARVEAEQAIIRAKTEAEARERGAKEAELKALKQKAANELYEALQLAEKEAAKNAVTAPTVIAPVTQAAPTVTRTESGSAYTKHPMVFEITDAALVPQEYLTVPVPDLKKIKDAVKMGVRSIPGVNIYPDNQVNFRT